MTQLEERTGFEAAGIYGVVEAIEDVHAVERQLDITVQAELGITFNQLLVLSEVQRGEGSATCTSLSPVLGREIHTVTSALNGLERKGLVRRTHLPGEDRRITRLGATLEGLMVLKGAESIKPKLLDSIRLILRHDVPAPDGGRPLAVCRLLGCEPPSRPEPGSSS